MNEGKQDGKGSGLSRRAMLRGTTSVVAASALAASANAQAADAQPVTGAGGKKPNIIMIVSDDFGWGDAGA
ncbi:hypothetical protein [Rhodopila globiformis]|uniref:hypothetical protein n=1 Tax=Rhodopila globiformis TaxID=1071 RepID=UPI00195B286F|nr:hypothetical protein [Rhodopila globiformis]